MRVILALVVLFLIGCSHFVTDPSMSALAAGDYTLMGSACQAMPGQGGDICRVMEGSTIAQYWTLVLPYPKKEIISGEVRIRYKGVVKSYPVKGPIVQIPWTEITGVETWTQEQDGLAEATGTIRYKGVTDAEFVDVLGIAMVVVLAPGYSPMPIDSGNQQFSTDCKIQYSTAGRSAIQCSGN